jgi:hypothetical protein
MNLDYILSRGLEEHLMVLQDGISRGTAEDYSTYREKVGEIRGIRFAMDLIVEARKRLGQDGDQE